MSSKLLIVNADDFGITRGATDAIVACHLAGSVTSTTLMSTQASAPYAAAQAAAHGRLGVGLHFNLTLGSASSTGAESSITAAGGVLLSRRELVLRALVGRLSSREVTRELELQYQAMRDMGLAPTHLDSHQHVHVLAPIFRVVSDFAARHKLPMRMPWRWQGKANGKSAGRRFKEAVMSLGLRHRAAVMPPQIRTNDGFCSVFDLGRRPGALDLQSYRDLLTPYKQGVVELMVHPADVDGELMGKTAITGVSAAEDTLLRLPEFVSTVREMGFRLGNYSDLRWS